MQYNLYLITITFNLIPEDDIRTSIVYITCLITYTWVHVKLAS